MRLSGFGLVLMLVPVIGSAELQPSRMFSEGMVLQRDSPVVIWGTADPGVEVGVSIHALLLF